MIKKKIDKNAGNFINKEFTKKSPYLIPHNAVNLVESAITIMRNFIKEKNINSCRKIDKKRKNIFDFNCLACCDIKTINNFKELESLYMRMINSESFVITVLENPKLKTNQEARKDLNNHYAEQSRIKKIEEDEAILKRIAENKFKRDAKSQKDLLAEKTIIEVNLDEFDIDSSRDVLKTLHFNEIIFPFFIGKIRFLSDKSTQEIMFEIENTQIILNIENQINIDFAKDSKTLGETLKDLEISIEDSDLIYNIFSVLMYLSKYKNDKKKIINKIEKRKIKRLVDLGDKIQGIEIEEKINIIKIDTIGYLNLHVNHLSSSHIEDKKWIVKGHWRNQLTKFGRKIIWISPFWKGNSEKIIKKIYKK